MLRTHLLKLYRLAIGYPKTVLVLAFVLAAIALVASRNLQIESDLNALLPAETQSVQDLDTLKQSFGGSSYLYIAVEASDRAVAESFADALAERVAADPRVLYVESKRPVDFFIDRKWLYLDLADLEEIDRRIDHALALQAVGISPMFNHLMDFADPEDLPDLSFQDILEKYQKQTGASLQGRAAEADGRFIVLKVRAADNAENIAASRTFIAQIKRIEAGLRRDLPDHRVTVGYTGGYQTKVEQVDAIAREVVVVSVVVALTLVGILLAYFRRVRAVFLIGIPLLVALAWTGGLTYAFLGHLNLITSFGAAILGGIGSDYGIYLLSRYEQERRAGGDFRTACDRAFSNTGRATQASMLTTVGAFGALLCSDFGVFVEFGLVGVLGLVSTYVAMMLVMPALLACWEHDRPISVNPRLLAFTGKRGKQVPLWVDRWLGRLFSRRGAAIGLAGVLLITVFSALTVPSQSAISFNSAEMSDSQLPGNRLYERISRMMGNSLTPTLLMVKRGPEEAAVLAAFEATLEGAVGVSSPLFRKVVGVSSFVPSDQSQKKAVLARLKPKFETLHIPQDREWQETVRTLGTAIAAPVTTALTLPPDIRRLFDSPYHPEMTLVYLFPAVDRGNSESLAQYRSGIATLKQDHDLRLVAADGNFVVADTVDVVRQEAPRGLALVMVFLGIILAVMVRPLSRAAGIMLFLVVGLVMLSGALWALGVPLNILNISAIAIVLGTGIDSFIHFSYRYDEHPHLIATMHNKAGAIMVSNLTTIVGFAGLFLSAIDGLRSIAWVTVLGLAVMTLLAVLAFPQSLVFLEKRRQST